MPQRVSQHISETAGFKLFSSKIPDNWIIRDVTERDYGIDCYLELVSDNNELMGELVSIQLKSVDGISWTQGDHFTLSGIKITTTNYWYKFAVPVFIFIADINNQELFFVPVKSYIKRHFSEFLRQDNFNYKILKINKFQVNESILTFRLNYYYERNRLQYENELVRFLSNLLNYYEFQVEHDGRDFHMGIESTDLIYFESMHKNYELLCSYLFIKNPIPRLSVIKENSKKTFNSIYYELFEQDLIDWMDEYKKLSLEIIREIKARVELEFEYWMRVNPTLYNYVTNIKEDGNLPRW